jgi:hypothetical protein
MRRSEMRAALGLPSQSNLSNIRVAQRTLGSCLFREADSARYSRQLCRHDARRQVARAFSLASLAEEWRNAIRRHHDSRAVLANGSFRALRRTRSGRVEMWRGSSRFGLSVAASFVWRCPNNFTLTPFPHPAHRTGHADLPHPALGQDITPSYTASYSQGPVKRTRPKCP